MRATALIAASLLAVSLAGCAGPKHDNDPDYDTGFTDGCSTGTSRSSGTPVSKATRDQALWDSSEAYRSGWKAGYSSCSPSRGDIPGDHDPDRR